MFDEVMEMIDREADGSDSLEVYMSVQLPHMLMSTGFHDDAFNCWWNWLWTGVLPIGKSERSISQETHSDILCFSKQSRSL